MANNTNGNQFRDDEIIGGTRFEVEYAVSLGLPVQLHWEDGLSQWIFQYSFPFWEDFFHRIRFELGG